MATTANALFVGSVPLSSTPEVFQRLASTFHSIRRIPDGEVGKRDYFVGWQRQVFSKCPWTLNDAFKPETPDSATGHDAGTISLNPLEYDDFAISSYTQFCDLRKKGVIPPGVRFQVSLPTPVNVILVLIRPEYHVQVEKLYEKALLDTLRRIQDTIPKEDLAIQWDAALEFAMLEDHFYPGHFCKAWFSPLIDGLKERFTRLTAAVDEGVEMGFHLCYGDMGHQHFVQPKDAGHLVDMANIISSITPREVNWFHMPVPKDRTDKEFYGPMKELKLGEKTELYLGIAHPWDLEGTETRIRQAKKIVPNFGIATECGLGRTPSEEFDAVMDVLAKVTDGKGSATI